MSVLREYASRPEDSRGRLYAEPASETRDAFQRDRDRIIHSVAFRRLEYKTQVFVNHEGDHYRTRLTHSLEVAQIARTLARCLGLNEDLAEALALAHDLGHTPFGHAGEDALDAEMAPFGGFDHNGQTLGIVTRLERCYPEFDGLNLTWETLEGIAKHNGPLVGPRIARDVPRAIAAYNAVHDLELGTYASAEAQVAALSDDIAYNNHDIDDGLRAGLFEVGDLADVTLVGPIFASVARDYPDIDPARQRHEGVRRMIGAMVGNCLAESRSRLKRSGVRSAPEVRALGAPVIAFSAEMREHDTALKSFLHAHMYRHDRVLNMAGNARGVVTRLFRALLADPALMPPRWRQSTDGPGDARTAGVVADYIAGMTDRFAFELDAKVRKLSAQAS
jgi:dGTPase